jgi:predicted nicotinamide N-methyase
MAGDGDDPGDALPKPSGGGFRIPKLAPAPPPAPDASAAPPPALDAGVGSDPAAAASSAPPPAPAPGPGGGRGARQRPPRARKHRHLLVFDLNGLLVDRRRSAFAEPDGTRRAPSAVLGKFHVYDRPHVAEFVRWAFEHFTVGVWSSAQQHNARALVNHVWGKSRDKLAFVWGQERCTHVGAMDPARGAGSKPILLKDLRVLWSHPSFARFGPRNTLLLDDSPYKAVLNPEHTAIHPAAYEVAGGAAGGIARELEKDDGEGGGDDSCAADRADARKTTAAQTSAEKTRLVDEDAPPLRGGASSAPKREAGGSDDVLGVGGALREYLSRLAEAEFVDDFVRANAWASVGRSAPPSDAAVMRLARRGASRVERAAEAAKVTGRDANEIDLPVEEESDDDPASAPIPEAGAPSPKRRKARHFDGSGASAFIRRWAWKREAKSDEERFERPYEHEMRVRRGADDDDATTIAMSFAQARHDAPSGLGGAEGGFASTVWDSSIVLAKYVEKHQERFRGLRVCELGAGCGLVSAALVKAGAARVVATDLAPNLRLLRRNLEATCGGDARESGVWAVEALKWGREDAAALAARERFDLAVAADCMYVPEAARDLAETLVALAEWRAEEEERGGGDEDPGAGGGGGGERSASADATARYRPGAVLMAHGRNRQAESAFEAAIEAVDVAGGGGGGGAEKGAEANRRIVALVRTPVADEDLDELYQCSDVTVAHYAARVVGAKEANAREAI